MASSDYDRPMAERPVAWSGPLGITLAIIFVVLLLMALLG